MIQSRSKCHTSLVGKVAVLALGYAPGLPVLLACVLGDYQVSVIVSVLNPCVPSPQFADVLVLSGIK